MAVFVHEEVDELLTYFVGRTHGRISSGDDVWGGGKVPAHAVLLIISTKSRTIAKFAGCKRIAHPMEGLRLEAAKSLTLDRSLATV